MCEPDDSIESRSPSDSNAGPGLSSVEPSNCPGKSWQFIEPHRAIDWLAKVVPVVLNVTGLWLVRNADGDSTPEELTQD